MPLTIEALIEFSTIDTATASLIVGITQGTVTPEYVSAPTGDWIRQCFNRPSDDELAMHAIDHLLEGFGVEGIGESDDSLAPYGTPKYIYVNMGDTYAATVIYNTETGDYFVACWGDIVEEEDY